MAAEQNITTKYNLDVSDFKKGITEANKSMKQANAEFNLATAGMNDWSTSSEGITAKLRQLDSVLTQQNKKVQLYQDQLDATEEAQAENAKRADELRAALTQLSNQGVSSTSAEYRQYQKALNDVEKEQAKNEQSANDLRTTLLNQQAAVRRTELEQSNYEATLQQVQQAERESAKTGKSVSNVLKDVGNEAEQTDSKVGKLAKGLGGALKKGLAGIAAGAGALVTAFLASGEASQEFIEDMGKLESAFTSAGHTAETAKESYRGMVGILGETDQSVEAVNHLAQLTDSTEELAQWTDIATGVYATFGDSLPIEGLTEAANETAKVGQVTGPLADALNWAGVSEDKFNESLAACNSEQERATLITTTLNGLYKEAADNYKEVNGDLIAARQAQSDLNAAMAEVGSIAMPINTMIKQFGANLLSSMVPGLQQASEGLKGLMSGAEGAEQQLSTGLTNAINGLLGNITSVLPNLLQVGLQVVTALIQGILQALPSVVDTVIDIIPQITQALLLLIPQLIDVGMQLIESILIGLGTMLPQIVNQVVLIIPQIVQSLINGIPLLINGAIQFFMAIIDAIPTIIQNLATTIPQIIDSIVDGLITGIPMLIEGAIQLLNAIVEAIPEIVPMISEAIPQIIDTLVNGLTTAIPMLIQGAITLLMAIVNAIPQILPPLIAALPQIITSIVNGLLTMLPVLLEGAIQLLMAIIQAIPIIIQALVPEIPNIIMAIVDGLLGALPTLLQTAVTLFMQLVKAIPQIAWELVKAVPQLITSIVNTLANGIGRITESAGKIGTAILDKIKEIPGKLVDVGKDLVQGLWNGINNAKDWILEKISNFGGDILDGIKGFFGISSPSKVMRDQVGRFISEGLGDGITKYAKKAIDPMTDLAKATYDQFNTATEDYKQLGEDMVNQYNQGLTSKIGTVGKSVKKLVDKARNALNNNELINTMSVGASNMLNGLGGTTTTHGATGTGPRSVVNNYNQVINAPKQPSRREIYRDTKNLLNLVKKEG